MTTDFKLKLYPALIGLLIGVLSTIIAIFALGRLSPALWTAASRSPAPGSRSANRLLAISGLPAIATIPWTDSITPPMEIPTQPAPESVPLPAIALPGRLRVSNATPHVVRVVLLSQTNPGSPVFPEALPAEPDYREPVHWDFAPGEGVGRGLLLSLPDGELQLQPNDVLMAFSLDGSQRYWGPYVVGHTPLPVWGSASGGDWMLELRPPAATLGP